MLTPLVMKLEHFLPLPDQDKEWLSGLVLRSEEFRAHSDIIREGEMPAGVFVVIAGHACRYKILSDGSRQILDFMLPGDKTQLYGLLLKATDHGISTVRPTVIAWIDRDRLTREMFDHPDVAIALWWNALQREAILRERIIAIGRRDAYARAAHLLCEMFERLRLVGETLDHNYRLPLTQAELGDARHLRGSCQPHAAAPAKREVDRLRPTNGQDTRFGCAKGGCHIRRALPPPGRRAAGCAGCSLRAEPRGVSASKCLR